MLCRCLIWWIGIGSLIHAGGWAFAEQPSASEILHRLDKLRVVGRILYIAAHPDDENTRLLSYLASERKVEAAYLSITRGDGGQNLIGTEQGSVLGLIRTHELLQARKVDGALQFFTRARDFGYSKTAEEALRLWGHLAVLEDVVWVIRTFQPDVIVTRFPEKGQTHGHHLASARLAREAFFAAADPTRFPHQIKKSRPWKARRLVYNIAQWFRVPPRPRPGTFRLDVGGYNPLFGRSYGEIASQSRSMHQSQGFGVPRQRGPLFEDFKILAGDHALSDLFEGIDLSWKRLSAQGTPILPPHAETPILQAIQTFRPSEPVSILPLLLRSLSILRTQGSPHEPLVRAKIAALQDLIQAVCGLFLDARSSLPRLVPGRPSSISLSALNRSTAPISLLSVTLESSALARSLPWSASPTAKTSTTTASTTPTRSLTATLNPATASTPPTRSLPPTSNPATASTPPTKSLPPTLNPAAASTPPTRSLPPTPQAGRHTPTAPLASAFAPTDLRPHQPWSLPITVHLPEDLPISGPSWLQGEGTLGSFAIPDPAVVQRPLDPSPLEAIFTVAIGGERLVFRRPVGYLWTDRVYGEMQRRAEVVPPITLTPDDPVLLFPDPKPQTLALEAQASAGPLHGRVSLELPEGWAAKPASLTIRFHKAGESRRLLFSIYPTSSKPKRAVIRPTVTIQGRKSGFQETSLRYPHIPYQTLLTPTLVKLVPLRVTLPTIRIGYIQGAGDLIVPSLRKIGLPVDILPNAGLSSMDLSVYRAIIVGIRAFPTNPAAVKHLPRLLSWVEDGGLLLLQYNVSNRWSPLRLPLGPYPFTIGIGRASDETAPVTFLPPKDPILSSPHDLQASDFAGWIQERGLYFASRWDPRYRTPLQILEPGEAPHLGSLLLAHHGRGNFLYTGLSFFRQLPAGVPGAYRLFLNLLSYPPRPHEKAQKKAPSPRP